jgi:hypothetical protein
MSRWSHADLARVNARLQSQISAPLDVHGQELVDQRRSKYRNVPVTVDGYQFDSKLEAKRFKELELLQKGGAITKLEFHKHWDLHVGGIKLGYYESDFSYEEDGKTVIEDTKGVRTPIFAWKRKHVLAEYGIEIREIKD